MGSFEKCYIYTTITYKKYLLHFGFIKLYDMDKFI